MDNAPSSAIPPIPAQAQAPAPAGAGDRTRLWAGVSAGLFPVAFVGAVVLLLSSVRVSGCVTYGVECTRGLPGWLFLWSAGAAGVAFLVALAAPRLRVRQWALGAQLLAECTAILVILSYYPDPPA
ncbi:MULTISPECIES: hypothetical protein [unclassified Streptomyces]|uniref:hypothetical protein n=1 Tax=unclassified Streptomyces TaxID=2593676 RepID=UPI00365F3907